MEVSRRKPFAADINYHKNLFTILIGTTSASYYHRTTAPLRTAHN